MDLPPPASTNYYCRKHKVNVFIHFALLPMFYLKLDTHWSAIHIEIAIRMGRVDWAELGWAFPLLPWDRVLLHWEWCLKYFVRLSLFLCGSSYRFTHAKIYQDEAVFEPSFKKRQIEGWGGGLRKLTIFYQGREDQLTFWKV